LKEYFYTHNFEHFFQLFQH